MNVSQAIRRLSVFAAAACLLISGGGISYAASEQDFDSATLGKKEKAVEAPVAEVSKEKLAPVEDQDADEKDETAPQEAAALTPELEGAGLYEKPGDGTLGRDLWEGASRAAITKLIQTMPASSRYAAEQKLIFGALLTRANTEKIKEDMPVAPGNDLLWLRLGKLIEGGAYQQALELYSSLELDNPPAPVARQGILAMLLTAQKGLACVELNSLNDALNAEEFFSALKKNCNTPENKAPLKEYVYVPETFGKLSLYEKAMIVADWTIKISEKTNKDFKDIPPADIQILMKAANLTDEDKYVLNVRALDWGLMSAEDFKKIYTAAIDPDVRLDPDLAVPEKAADWEKLPFLLQLATNKKSDEEKWTYIRSAFLAAQKYGLSALSPFSELIYKVRPKDANFQEMRTAALILNRNGYKIPSQWIDIIDKYSPALDEKKTYTRLLAAAYLSKSDGRKDEELKQRIYKDLPMDSSSSTFFIKNIIENVDKPAAGIHNPDEIYENDYNLTFQQDYVMPSMVLWNRLLEAGHQGLPGETILLSAAALRETDLDKIYPGLFQDTLSSLKNVGLTDISDNLAITAILGNDL